MTVINPNEVAYLDLLRHVRNKGKKRIDRTGTGTIGIFGAQARYDLRTSFPLLTTKKMLLPSVSSELIWFLEGSMNERRLAELRFDRDRADLTDKTTIWTKNAEAEYWTNRGLVAEPGDLGRVYGAQWRDWRSPSFGDGTVISVDQIEKLVHGLKTDPYGRRHIVTAWNPGELDQMALPPCHILFQCHVQDGELSLQWYQRSVDKFLGEPFNIASYAMLTKMLAQVTNLMPGDLIHSQGDSHIYLDHLDAVDTQLEREPLPAATLAMDESITNIFDFKVSSFELIGYSSHAAIPAPMAV